MTMLKPRVCTLFVVLVAALCLAGTPLFGQGSENAAGVGRAGLPHDWSHRHLIFSPPTSIQQYLKVSQEPRYWHQQYWRYGGAQLGPGNSWSAPGHNKDGGSSLKGDWSMDMGSGAKVGAAMFPAKYSFNPIGAPDCTNDFVVFNTGLAGSSSQATIIAYNKLYPGASPGCGTTGVPAVYWQYNTGTGSTITNSVALSADGKQVAFVQNSSSNVASLVLLKWKSGAAIVAPTSVSASSYSTCTTPCMTVLTFTNSHHDTHSAPFYDFAHDTIYVGDDPTSTTSCTSVNANCANLHQFTGVFKGTPAEVTTGGWPVFLAAAPLSSPVYDATSGYVFSTSSYDGTSNGGRLHQVLSTGGNSATGQVTSTTAAGGFCVTQTSSSTAMVLDAPIVDSSAGKVYVFSGNDGGGHAGVFQFAPGYAQGACGIGALGTVTEVTVGTGSTSGVPLYSGDFDNIYYISSQSSPTGHLYVCGNTVNPALYQVAVTSNALGAATAGPQLATGTSCSPVSEFLNGSTDWIFLSVQANSNTGSPVSCPSAATGCIMSFNVTSASGFGTSKATAAKVSETGGTSGIVIDNASTATGASQVYFSTLANQACTGGTGGCAIQATQSGLN